MSAPRRTRVLLLTQWFDPEPTFKGLVFARELVRQGLAILATQPRGNDRGNPHGIRPVADYSMPNVSDKVLRIVHSYTDYVNRVVWKKY